MKFLNLFCAFSVLLATLILPSLGKPSDELLVTLGHGGGVSGHFRTSHSGRGIYAFTNIPFAEPPVGELRFKDAVDKAPWTGYLPINREDIQCPQKQVFSNIQLSSGTEDCLYLNVYVPQFDQKKQNLPVMVYIHGGGFMVGTGSLSSFDPANLQDNDVIIVSINYRLGILGFLSTFDEHLPGNLGLKDQQFALKWVQENIKYFGGDKDSVTIFGVSAGGASVGFQMLSPNSEGLFHKAIVQSGTPFDSWALQDKGVAQKNSRKLFKSIGCDGLEEDKEELLKCLQKVPVESFTATWNDFFEWHMDPLVSFGPVVEGDYSANAFIKEADLKRISDVPLIIGVCTDEGVFKSAFLSDDKETLADLDKRFDEILPSILGYSHYCKGEQEKITKKIKKFYFGDAESNFSWNNDKHTFTMIVSDGMFVSGFGQFLELRLSQKTSANTFAYMFNYNGASSITTFLSSSETNFGVSHGEDMVYLSPFLKVAAPNRILSEKDMRFGKSFVRMWTDFAVYGDPTRTNKHLSWTPATAQSFNYLRIGNCNRHSCPEDNATESKVLQNPFQERLAFWKELKKTHKITTVHYEL